MRAARLLSALLLLQVHHKLTARVLAERLEVSERTIHRDMEALCAAGVPLYAERGPAGGWVLPDSYRTELPGLTEAEVQAVFLTTPPRLLADLGLDKAADAALVKLFAALPSVMQRDAESMRRRIHVDASGWRRGDDPTPWLGVLQEAVWRDRQIDLAYQRADGSPVQRTVDPLGLVAKGSLWYLVAAVDGEIRSYRASRVQSATVLERPGVRPPGFDLAAYWAGSTAEFVANLPRFAVSVRMAPEALRRIWIPGSYAQVIHVGEPDEDGWRTVDLTLQSEPEAITYALGFGASLRILAPDGLKERVLQAARDLVAAYTATEVREPAAPV